MKNKDFESKFIIDENGRSRIHPDHKEEYDRFIATKAPGEILSFIVQSEANREFYDWLGWYFGILMPLCQYHLEMPEIAMRDKGLCSHILKAQFAEIEGFPFYTEKKNKLGEVTYILFSLNITDGISYENRMKFTRFIKNILESNTEQNYSKLENQYRIDNNIEPNKFNYTEKQQ